MTRLELLEQIAAAAKTESELRHMLVTATDSRLVMDRLTRARVLLDEALEDLRQLERE